MKFPFYAFLAIMIVASTPGLAMAYMDAGTFSYVVQILVASLVGISVAIKVYWHRLKSLFFSKKTPASGAHENSGENVSKSHGDKNA